MKNFIVICMIFTVLLTTSGSLWPDDDGKVNINTASAEELETLVRVGPVYADRIIDYRENNGPFEKPEDIMNVSGIGLKTYELNKHRIVVE